MILESVRVFDEQKSEALLPSEELRVSSCLSDPQYRIHPAWSNVRGYPRLQRSSKVSVSGDTSKTRTQ